MKSKKLIIATVLSLMLAGCAKNTSVLAKEVEEHKEASESNSQMVSTDDIDTSPDKHSSSSLNYPDSFEETIKRDSQEKEGEEQLNKYRDCSVTVRYGHFLKTIHKEELSLNYYIVDYEEAVQINFKFCKGYVDNDNNILDSYTFKEDEEFKMYFEQYTFQDPREFNAIYIFVDNQ